MKLSNKAARPGSGTTGYSLVEMVIAVSIIAILASIAVPAYIGYRKKAMTTEAKAGLGDIRKLQTSYFSENDAYSNNLNQLGFSITANKRYTYSVLGVWANGYSAAATANLDNDPVLDTWTIDHTGTLLHPVID